MRRGYAEILSRTNRCRQGPPLPQLEERLSVGNPGGSLPPLEMGYAIMGMGAVCHTLLNARFAVSDLCPSPAKVHKG